MIEADTRARLRVLSPEASKRGQSGNVHACRVEVDAQAVAVRCGDLAISRMLTRTAAQVRQRAEPELVEVPSCAGPGKRGVVIQAGRRTIRHG